MQTQIEHEETKTLYEIVKLTTEEIQQIEPFNNLGPDQLEKIRQTVFNLSLILLKLHT